MEREWDNMSGIISRDKDTHSDGSTTPPMENISDLHHPQGLPPRPVWGAD